MPKPPKTNARDRPTFAVAGVLALLAGTALAAEPDLLPPERAFAFSARGLDPNTVEARFAVANGYYLYREKLRFTVEPLPLSNAPALPTGLVKEDAFFGRVETYRGELVVRLSLQQPAAGSQVTVKAESQGCADIGVCYPPQVQQVKLALPAAGSGPGTLVEANPTKKRWFQ
jgi:thiol:disulfide interchange protein DsbD